MAKYGNQYQGEAGNKGGGSLVNRRSRASREELYEEGRRYYEGKGVQRNYRLAVLYFMRAAEQGFLPAQSLVPCSQLALLPCRMAKEGGLATYWISGAHPCKAEPRSLAPGEQEWSQKYGL